MNSAEKSLPHYTYEEWEHWEGRWELIYGIPHAMSPLPTLKHHIIATKLASAFTVQLMECNSCVAIQPVDYKVTKDTVLQPDMVVVCGEVMDKKYLDFPPSVVLEVLSPSTAHKDLNTKYSIYEFQGVRYYIIIAPDKEDVKIYELIDGEYHLKQNGRNIAHDFFFPECNARIDFKKIW